MADWLVDDFSWWRIMHSKYQPSHPHKEAWLEQHAEDVEITSNNIVAMISFLHFLESWSRPMDRYQAVYNASEILADTSVGLDLTELVLKAQSDWEEEAAEFHA
ncbi:hypothetical protein WJX73_005508 [Symbiochloris irregularis]|uniref:Uncharacterized protein n=1 Tax=Symbiochloris irregularis TaxID=706552 RepID=A0AAW1PEJ7_9CHLO